ncbi:hypothetical protein GO988_11750 [Hymenobacter sp. HMF4947]|uniref:Uncharacterized protein n=1 Tax=Hymenobacter ginkgonis TaxID=2682976 RepID=A0A7K1TF14_9BACT|nr:hypothetical protein [Hymenobacter ginkgonis]MVN77000.1 hypothetical protein [Hymenobacter ginkgonis]
MNPISTPPTSTTKRLQQLLFSALLLTFSAFAQPAHAQTWMVSTTAYIKLGILDKFNSLGGYEATFFVTDEKTQAQYMLTKQIPKGESGVDVLFPSEPSEPEYFKNMKGTSAQPTPGRYTWECRVNGKKAVGGRFTFPETANDINVIGQR